MRGPYLETQGHDARPVSTSRTWFRRRAGPLALALGVLCAMVFSGIVFVYSTSIALPLVYFLAWVVSIVLLFFSRRDVLSPVGIGALVYIPSFLLCVPFYVAFLSLERGAPSSPDLALSVGLSLLALLGYSLGCVCRTREIFRPLFRAITSARSALRPCTHGEFILLAVWVVVAGVTRIAFRLEVAGAESPLLPGRIAGVVGYMFHGGTLVLIGLFLYRSLSRGRIFILEGYVLASGLVLTQLLLGWKSALLGVVQMTLVVFWYQAGPGGRRRSFFWVFVLIVLIPVTMMIGQEMRSTIIKGQEAAYAEGISDFVLKVVTRLDGNSRFVAVLNYETRQGRLSLTNDFKFISLIRLGITTTKYADVYVFGHPQVGAASSTGASGPGGAYIGMGLCGIVLGYFLLGNLVGCVYHLMQSLWVRSLAIVLYGMMFSDMLQLFQGNLVLSLKFKQYIVYSGILILAKMFLRGRTKREPVPLLGGHSPTCSLGLRAPGIQQGGPKDPME